MDARKEAWLAVSAVNLLFFRRWAEVLPGGHDYFLETARAPSTYVSLMLLILVLSALAWGVVVLARRSGRPWPAWTVRGGFLVVVTFGIIGIIAEGWVFVGRPEVPALLAYAALGIFLLGAAYVVARKRQHLRRAFPVAVTLVLITSPLGPIMFAQGAYHAFTPETASARFTPPLAGPVGAEEATGRFVIVIFDELDERLLFEDRPADLELPELDGLRAGSLHATHAFAADSATLRAIPAMTTGRPVEYAQAYSIDGNLLHFRDGGKADWREAPTLFDDARALGHDVGIVGTYHPYCRIFEDVLSKCFFKSHYVPEPPSFGGEMVGHANGWLSKSPLFAVKDALRATFGDMETIVAARQEREIGKARVLSDAAVEMVADPTLDLVFVHINAPHPTGSRGHGFGYYDPVNHTYATGTDIDYFDNLVLVDDIVGRMREAMTEAGVWNDTTLLITADHGYRADLWAPAPRPDHPDPLARPTEHRLPFLLKVAGTTEGRDLDTPFNMVLLRPLAAAVLAGEIPDIEAAVAWLERNAGPEPVPEYKSH